MVHRRTLRFLLGSALLALPLGLLAQAADRAPVEQVQAKKGDKITCPFEEVCDVQGQAFSINNPSGIAIAATGKIGGVLAQGPDPEEGIGVFGYGGFAGVIGFGSFGPGVKAISQVGDLFVACFNTQGFGCNNGNAARIDNEGTVFANGGFVTGGADVAEFVRSADAIEPGDVVEIDVDHAGSFRKASHRASTTVAGVISTTPGLTMNDPNAANVATHGPRLALVGRVRVKATAVNGGIRPGDLLVSSATPGRAMRAGKSPRPGTVFGKALERLDHGDGTVEMLVWAR
jgi:hypothetical protein